MSVRDFELCTPLEFNGIAEEWMKREREKVQTSWEQVRMGCLCTLQSQSTKKLRATDVIKFPWDKKERKKLRKKPVRDGLTNEERIEKIKKEWGVTD